MAGEAAAVDDEKLEQAAFTAAVTTPEVPAEKPAGEPAVAASTVETPPAEPAPEYVQITKDQLSRLMASADKTDTMDGQFSKVFGTVGNLKQLVDKVQAATPAGVDVELSDEVFAEMAEDYPELSKGMRSVFEKAFKKLNLRGTAPPAAATPAPVPAEAASPPDVDALVEQALIKKENAKLIKAYPTWRAIVGQEQDKDNDFRKWLATQSAEFQKEIHESQSPAEVQAALDRFTAAKKAPPPKPAQDPAPRIQARKDRIQGAVAPKGDGSPPPPGAMSEQEGFRQGFRGG